MDSVKRILAHLLTLKHTCHYSYHLAMHVAALGASSKRQPLLVPINCFCCGVGGALGSVITNWLQGFPQKVDSWGGGWGGKGICNNKL